MKTEQINGAAGLRNDIDTERFASGDLLVGQNIDIDETGKVSRRAGTTQLSSGATSSLWSNGALTLFVRNNSLYRRHASGLEEVLKTGVGKYVAFTDVNGAAYASDGHQAFVIDAGGNVRQWGVEPPLRSEISLTPTVGALKAGTYGVTAVYLRQDGHESGAPGATFIAVSENNGVRVTLPISNDPRVTHKRVYMTGPDGTTFYEVARVRNAVTNTTVAELPANSLPLRTQFKTCAPAGQVVGFFAGRTWIANGANLFYSDPYEFELFDMRSNFIPFDADVTLFAPTNNGVFVGTTKDIAFFQGRDIESTNRVVVANYGAVRGSLFSVAGNYVLKGEAQTNVAMWMTTRGVCAGFDDGSFVNLTGSRYQVSPATQGAGLFKLRNGTPQYLVSLFV